MLTKADHLMVESIRRIQREGCWDEDPRPHYADGTPAHTKFVNHAVRQYNLDAGEFPILTLRPIGWKGAIKELFWIYKDGSNDLTRLREEYNLRIWDLWALDDDTIGCRYGHTVNLYNLAVRLIDGLVEDPFGRRHIIDLWQEEEFALDKKGLKPCAFCTVWNVRKQNGEMYLDMLLLQRSGDLITASGAGGWNEVQYAAFLVMVASHCGYKPGVFTHVVANEHLYDRHMDWADELLRRYDEKLAEERSGVRLVDGFYVPNNSESGLRFVLDPPGKSFFERRIEECSIPGYEPMKPQFTLELAV